MKLLIVEDDRDILELLEVMVLEVFEGEVLATYSAENAIELLEQNDNIVMILSDYRMKGGGAPLLYEVVKEKYPQIPFGILSVFGPESNEVFSTFYEDNPKNFHLSKPFQLRDLEREILSCVPNSSSAIEKSPYLRLSSNVLKRITPDLEIYIRLSDKKYVAIFHKGEFDLAIIDNYIARGVESFYLNRNDFASLMTKQILKSQEMIQGDDAKSLFAGIEEVQLALTELGTSEEVIKYTETLVEEGLKSFRNYSKLDELLALIDSASGYVQKHAYLTSYISVAIAQKLPDFFQEQDHRRLIMASFFKDVALIEEPDLASIYVAKDPRFSRLSEQRRHQVRIHMQDAAHILDSVPEFDSKTRELVLSHHERLQGDGFPRGKNLSSLDDLSYVFMLSCHFAHDIITNELNKREVTLLAQNYAYEYTGERLEKIYHGFVRAFQKIQPDT